MTSERRGVHTPAPVDAFITRLEQLEKGPRAMLRRQAGNTLSESSKVFNVFYRIYPKEQTWFDEEIYFLIATLFGPNKGPAVGNFGETMRALKLGADSSSIDRRMGIVLDSEFDSSDGRDGGGTLAFRLRQLIRLAESRDVGINWRRLLADLLFWSHPDKRVQQTWARSYYSASEPSATDTQESIPSSGGSTTC